MFMGINEICGYGPLILIVLSWFILWDKDNLFFYYTVGLFLNSILNIVLKGFFMEPRPNEQDLKKFNLAITTGKKFLFKNGIPFNIFGMPSGHVQSALFSTIYIYLCNYSYTNNTYTIYNNTSTLKSGYDILYLLVTISLITIFQRIYYKYHTILQVIVGGIVGGLFAYIMYYIANKNYFGKQSFINGKKRENVKKKREILANDYNRKIYL